MISRVPLLQVYCVVWHFADSFQINTMLCHIYWSNAVLVKLYILNNWCPKMTSAVQCVVTSITSQYKVLGHTVSHRNSHHVKVLLHSSFPIVKIEYRDQTNNLLTQPLSTYVAYTQIIEYGNSFQLWKSSVIAHIR